ncbi:MAG: phosphate ABC transporter permease PstA [Dehalococcoidales bacterium]|nr:phosphate ABC transporter permease PstA [Dehalococcoidales bacterium]
MELNGTRGRLIRTGMGLHDYDVGFWRRRLVNRIATGLIALSAAVGVAVLLIILVYVAVQGAPALNLAFFTERPLPFGEVGGGVAPAILGTLYMLIVAAVLGVPVGVGTGIYLSEYGTGRFATSVRFVIDLVAGLPSIVVGVFVWALLVRHVVGGFSGLAGSVALAIIMVPIISRTVEEVLRLVPDSLREASLALGVPRWRTILRVVLPTARAGVVTGVVLAMARAGGETAPLLLTALGNQFFNLNIMGPMASLPVQIYNYASSPFDDWHTKAWGGALVLIGTIGILSLVTRLVTRGQIKR